MINLKEDLQRLPQNVGSFISTATYIELVSNFRVSFPDEVQSLPILKSVIAEALVKEDVSGIRFMYGMKNADDPSSRLIILMPSNYTMTASIPNVIFDTGFFYTSSGEKVSTEETWSLLFNHVLRFRKTNPDVPYTKITRGYFAGRNKLSELLAQTQEAVLTYHFGYDTERDHPFKAIIQPTDNLEILLEDLGICPTGCPPEESSCITTFISNKFEAESDADLDVLRAFRTELLSRDKNSGIEVEKYYSISASILEGIKQDTDSDAVLKKLYNDFFRKSIDRIQADDKAKAFELFKECMKYLTDRYLYQ